jgi:hypothetical protein
MESNMRFFKLLVLFLLVLAGYSSAATDTLSVSVPQGTGGSIISTGGLGILGALAYFWHRRMVLTKLPGLVAQAVVNAGGVAGSMVLGEAKQLASQVDMKAVAQVATDAAVAALAGGLQAHTENFTAIAKQMAVDAAAASAQQALAGFMARVPGAVPATLVAPVVAPVSQVSSAGNLMPASPAA